MDNVKKFEPHILTADEVPSLDDGFFTYSTVLQMRVSETIDAFFFDTVLPYCSQVERRIVTKDELIRALTLLREQEQKEQHNAES